jgi:flagellar basal body-associated protein FliL
MNAKQTYKSYTQSLRAEPNQQEDKEMNAGKSYVKSLMVMLIVAFATLMAVGSVAAEHGSGPVHAEASTTVRFEQYLEALETENTGSGNVAPVPASQATRVRFTQYNEALVQQERERFATVETASIDVRMSRMSAFEQYMTAIELAAETMVEPKRENHSGIRFEQYLWALTQ